MKDDVIVGGVLRALVIVAAQRLIALAVPAKDMERARHAEMHEQHVAGRQIGQQIFGPPAEAGDGVAFEAAGEILRQRPAQIAAVNLDLGEARALHRRLEAAAHRFDFGKFGHCSIRRAGRGNMR